MAEDEGPPVIADGSKLNLNGNVLESVTKASPAGAWLMASSLEVGGHLDRPFHVVDFYSLARGDMGCWVIQTGAALAAGVRPAEASVLGCTTVVG